MLIDFTPIFTLMSFMSGYGIISEFQILNKVEICVYDQETALPEHIIFYVSFGITLKIYILSLIRVLLALSF